MLHQKKTDNKTRQIRKMAGFTLVEMLIVIGLIALLATSVLVAVNPSRQFKFARDTERKAHLATILNAVGQNIAEHDGVFTCNDVPLPLPQGTPQLIQSGSASLYYDLAPCIVPTYLSKLPFDPNSEFAWYEDGEDYATMYKIFQDTNGHITVSAKSEMDPSADIVLTR